MKLTKRRIKEVDEWIARYDIIDYWSDIYSRKMVYYGQGRDRKLYKKIIR